MPTLIPFARRHALSAVTALLFAPCWAAAVNLPPGAGVALPGTAGGPGPGTIMVDDLIPFRIYSSGGALLYEGNLQNRVVKLDGTGNVAFLNRVISTRPGLNGQVSAVASVDFTGFTADVDYSTTSVGTVAPTRGLRSNDGALISFFFGSGYVGSSQESRFMHVVTDTQYWTRGGATTLTLSTGENVVLPTVKPVRDDTPPVVAITSPAPLACVCNPVGIYGTARDPQGFDHYVLEYAVNAGGPWTTITTSTTPVDNGLLGTWDVTALSQGYYFIRLTATNSVGLESSITTIVFVDKQFDVVDLRSPADRAIVGGIVCFDGTVNDGNGLCSIQYTVDYSAGSGWNPVDPATPVHVGGIYNDPLGWWNTRAGIADGLYKVRVVGLDGCGYTKTVSRSVTVDNTPPTAFIREPLNCRVVSGAVTVRGTVADAHLAGWVLQYTGGDAHGWLTIATGTGPVIDGVLGVWKTEGLRRCAYTIRLVATDATVLDCDGAIHSQAEYLVSVYLGPTGHFDYDGDGDVDMVDFGVFQQCAGGPAIPAPPECLE